MTRLQFTEVISCLHQDVNHPPTNLLCAGSLREKWLSDPVKFHFSLTATLRLQSPSVIEKVELQNAGSSSLVILVSVSDRGKYSVLLPETILRTEEECKNRSNMSALKTLTTKDFQTHIHSRAWSCVRLLCYHARRKSASEQFGLSFINFHGEPVKPSTDSLEDLKNSVAVRNSSPLKNSVLSKSLLERNEKMMIATKARFAPTSPVESKTCTIDDDVFDACVLTFLKANAQKNLSNADLITRWQESNGSRTMRHKQRFIRLLNKRNNNAKPTGILTPHDNNRPKVTLSSSLKSIKESTLNVLKPPLSENSNALRWENNLPQLYRTEMSTTKPVNENGVYGDQSTKENQHPCMLPGKAATADGGCSPEGARKSFKDSRKIWKGGRSEDDEEDDEDISPNQSFKRKSDSIERNSFSLSKKRLRDTRTNSWASTRRVSPVRNGPAPSPPPRPESPLVDDIDAPSTSSKETVAERNIRLESERRLAQRPPQDRVMRAPSGKVRGPYCTKGVTARTSPSEANSPLRRLSLCEDTDEESRLARRKLNFPKSSTVTSMVECPFCSGLYDSADIEQHASECAPSPSPSPRKQAPPELEDDDDDMMACPICMTFVSRETVAAHADQCALRRYGA